MKTKILNYAKDVLRIVGKDGIEGLHEHARVSTRNNCLCRCCFCCFCADYLSAIRRDKEKADKFLYELSDADYQVITYGVYIA